MDNRRCLVLKLRFFVFRKKIVYQNSSTGMKQYILIAQIISSIVLVALVLLQNRGAALGSSFGGEGGGFYSTRRGFEKKILWATIIFGIIFIALAVANLAL